jgi:autotransporter strand-loop-strand O-heptosyltransferase
MVTAAPVSRGRSCEKLIPLFRDSYPDITFVATEQVKVERYYATYSIGLFFDDKEFVHQPCDFRHVGLHRTAGYILRVDPTEVPLRLTLADDTRPIAEPYVCIGVQSTTQSKYWNNPGGWRELVGLSQRRGLSRHLHRSEAHPRDRSYLEPHTDQTGDRPLQERARWLKHADSLSVSPAACRGWPGRRERLS